jgi:myo-inositol-1(or 4)-monophosphatase
LNPWDVAAGSFLIQQAGGKICDFEGGDDWMFGGTIVAASSSIFEEFSDIIRSIFINSDSNQI